MTIYVGLYDRKYCVIKDISIMIAKAILIVELK
jgi:hypothetical protein